MSLTPSLPAVSPLRLNLLRATYLLLMVGMGVQVWPKILVHSLDVEQARTVVRSVLGAVTRLPVLLGLRHPLEMLPLLFLELAWKSIWVLSFGLPLWSAGRLDGAALETMQANLFGLVLFPLVIPWGYVWARYVRAPRSRRAAQSQPLSRAMRAASMRLLPPTFAMAPLR